MQIAVIDGATRVIGKSQGYLGLPLRDEPINCTIGGDGTPSMVTAWHPSEEDILAIINGAAIHVRLIGSQHPPIMLDIGPVPA